METGAVSGLSRFACCVLICCCTVLNARADAISVIVTPVPVFNEVNANGELSGYTVDLIRGMLEEAELEGQIRPEPLARMLTDLKNNPAQLGASLVRTPEREDQYYWISPVTAIPNHVYVKANSQLAETGITSLSELSGVAVRRNDYRHTLLEQAEVADILAVNSWEQAIELLLADRVNALLYSSAGLRLMCEKAHMDCSELNPIYTRSTVVSYIVLPKVPENAELANLLSVAAAKFKSQQQFEALTEKVNQQLATSGLSGQLENGVLFVVDNGEAPKNEHLWVLGELSGDFAKLNSINEMVGYNADLVRRVLGEANISASVLAVPWQRLLRETLHKPNVLSFAVARTAEREERFHWITPITRNTYGLFGLGESAGAGIDQIPKGKIVGTLKHDFRAEIAAAANLPTLEYDSWGATISALYNDDVDFVFTSPWSLRAGCRQVQSSCQDISMDYPYQEVTTWLVLSKPGTSMALVEKLKAAAKKVKSEDKYVQWAERWVSDINMRNNTAFSVRDGIIYLYSNEQLE